MKTINRKMMDAWRMIDAGEFMYPTVVDKDRVFRWNGVAWADEREATPQDYEHYPVVVEDEA